MQGNVAATRTGSKSKRRLSIAGFAFYIAAVLVAASPWLTGLYTSYQQKLMLTGMERKFAADAAKTKAHEPRTAQRSRGPFDGWAMEDAAFWKKLGDGKVWGRITIKRIGVNIAVVKGVSKTDLKLGPGWMTTTDMPGPTGNTVISGHRTTYLAPFRRIDELKVGDVITIESPFRIYTYKVYKQLVVDPSDKKVLAYTRQPELTMTACHPPYTAWKRIIVKSQLVGVKKR